MKTFLTIVLAMLVSTAWATKPKPMGPTQFQGQGQGQGQLQGQAQGQGQGQIAKGGHAQSGAAAGAVAGAAAIAKGGKGGHGGDASGQKTKVQQGVQTKQKVGQSVGTNVQDNSDYKVPPVAVAGYSNNIIRGCDRILGFDFRGAGNDAAGGASFGLPFKNGDCQLEKATMQAFQLGNYEMGWKLYCAQKSVWKGYQLVAKAQGATTFTKFDAISGCIDTGMVVTEARADQPTPPVVDLTDYATREEVTETVDRAFGATLAK